jgi:hypothetical protein
MLDFITALIGTIIDLFLNRKKAEGEELGQKEEQAAQQEATLQEVAHVQEIDRDTSRLTDESLRLRTRQWMRSDP